MMGAKATIGADAAKLAGLQIDFLSKVRSGQIKLNHIEWFNNLTKEERDGLVSRGTSNLSDGVGRVGLIQPKMLEIISTTIIPATTTRFVAREKFVINTHPNASVKIDFIDPNFEIYFLDGDGKIEEPLNEQTLRCSKSRKRLIDTSIIAELGGEAKAETTLGEIYALMAKWPNSEERELYSWNIFYVRDQGGVLRIVAVRWSDDGWSFSARSVEIPYKWGGRILVFSRLPAGQAGNS